MLLTGASASPSAGLQPCQTLGISIFSLGLLSPEMDTNEHFGNAAIHMPQTSRGGFQVSVERTAGLSSPRNHPTHSVPLGLGKANGCHLGSCLEFGTVI